MSVQDIVMIEKDGRAPYIPPLSDYQAHSECWEEAEYHCYRSTATDITCGYWEGEPGSVRLSPWPYDEICVLLSGRVALIDDDDVRREFSAGDAFQIPAGFSGTWETVERSRKVYIAATPAGDDDA